MASLQQILLAGSLGLIKSVQNNVQVAIAAGSTTGTASFGTADPNYTMIVPNGLFGGTSLTAAKLYAAITVSGSTITATRATSDATYGSTTNLCLVEFYPWAIKSIQRGTMTSAGTQAITSVDTSKAFVMNLGWNTTGSLNQNTQGYVVLTNATTLTCTSANGANNYSWQVVEFNAGVLQSAPQPLAVTTTSTSTDTTLGTTINANCAFLAYGGYQDINSGGAYGIQHNTPRIAITSNTNVNVKMGSSGANGVVAAGTVVEFMSKWIKSNAQRGDKGFTGTTTGDQTITAVGSKAMLNHSGYWFGYSTGGSASELLAGLTLSSATNVHFQMSQNPNNATNGWSYEVLEFN